ncbi:MAG: BrnT family toxin [Acidobacteriia bacterium]|nr:BrnT family toxin [Terriglobia bacterium]
MNLRNLAFEWDSGKQTKSADKHAVTCDEAEEVFETRRFVPLGRQIEPVPSEPRFGVLGETLGGRLLFIAFTIRKKIRVISARPANRKERDFYASLRQK